MSDVLLSSLPNRPASRFGEETLPSQIIHPAVSKPVDPFRGRILTVMLCGVVFVSMTNGLVKQALNWSQGAYIALDVPWVAFLIVWAVWPRPLSRTNSGGIGLLLTIFLAYSAVQIFNPLSESPFMAIAAIRNRLLPMLFFWVGKDLLKPKRAGAFLMFVFVMAAIGAAFGILEWKVGLVGVTRWGKGFVPRTSLAWRTADGESVIRPLSIYQDGGISALFGGAVLFCMTMVYAGRRTDPAVWFARFCGVLCVAFVAVSGVRAAVLCTAQGLLAAGFLSTKRIIPLAVALVAALGLMGAVGAWDKLAERYETILNPIEAYQKNRGDIALGFVDLISYSPLGYGTGTASPATEFYAKTFGGIDKPHTLQSDNGFGNLVAEGGIPLVALYVVLLMCIAWQAWQRRNASGPARSVSHAVFVFTAILAMWSATALPIDWQPTNIVFWLLAGSMFAGPAPASPQMHRTSRHETILAN